MELWMQREGEHGKESEQRPGKRENKGLYLETETFTSCAVLNAKHVSAYWLLRLFRRFPSLRLLRGGGMVDGGGRQRTG